LVSDIKGWNRVLKSIFCPKTDKVTGGWRKLHNEDLHNLYSSPSIREESEVSGTVIVVITASVKEDEREGQGHTSASISLPRDTAL
jgi:hypothetical protein